MRAVVFETGPAEQLQLVTNADKPILGEHQILMRVTAFGLNRADIAQRRGKYPAPPGVRSDILGLEAAGVVVDTGNSAVFALGDRVMALLGGAGYAEYVAVDEGSVMKIPDSLSDVQAAAIPENYLTSYGLLFLQGKIAEGETLCVYAAGSGIGVTVIQLAKLLVPHVKIVAVAGEQMKLETAKQLGADFTVNYKEEKDWEEKVMVFTGGKGVDVVLDCVGASFASKTLHVLGMDSRWVMYGTMGGDQLQISMGFLMRKRVQVVATSLRGRSLTFKKDLVKQFEERCLASLQSGKLKLIIDKVFDVVDIVAAHRYMEDDRNIGKIVVNFPKLDSECKDA